MVKCCICKAKAWCYDDDGKTPYCSSCFKNGKKKEKKDYNNIIDKYECPEEHDSGKYWCKDCIISMMKDLEHAEPQKNEEVDNGK